MDYLGAAETSILFLLLTNCAYTDLRKGKIPNAASLSLFVTGVLFLAARGRLEQLPGRLLAAAAAVLLLFPLWELRGLGAGDIKLLAALAMFMTPADLVLCIATAFVLSLVPAAGQLLTGHGIRARVHFAVPIAVAAMIVVLVPDLGERVWSSLGGV